MEDYSDFLYVYYTGPDCWGPETSSQRHDYLCWEFEHRIQERYPGLLIFHTLERGLIGVVGHPYLTAQSAALETEIHNEIQQIAQQVNSEVS
jgi:hypothetical protein